MKKSFIRKPLSILLSLLMLLSVFGGMAFPASAAGGVVFYDGFESGDLSIWQVPDDNYFIWESCGDAFDHQIRPHSGDNLATITNRTIPGDGTEHGWLITHPYNLSTMNQAYLSFWFLNSDGNGNTDGLNVYYKVGNGDWVLLESITGAHNEWTQMVYELPTEENVSVAFDVIANDGAGVAIDDFYLADFDPAPIEYIDENGDSQSIYYELPERVGSSSTSWISGWFVVDEEVEINGTVKVYGDVSLILCDGASLTVNGGIHVTAGDTLTIYGQTNGTGALNASGVDGSDADSGDVYLYGGVINGVSYPINNEPTAPAGWYPVAQDEISDGDTVIVTATTSLGATYGLYNANSTEALPDAVLLWIDDDGRLRGYLDEETDLDTCIWDYHVYNSAFVLSYPGDGGTMLTCGSENTSVQVGGDGDSVFTLNENGYIYNATFNRFLAVHTGNQQWNVYSRITNSIANQTLTFWKYVGGGSNDPGNYCENDEHVLDYASNGDGTHTITCENCDFEDSDDCDFEVTEEHAATYTTGEYKTYTCTKCGYSYDSEPDAPLPHVHDYVLDEAASTPATCTEPGEDVYVCQGEGECDEPSYSVGIPAPGHDYEDGTWETTLEPQIGVAGEETLFCGRCGDPIDTREIDPLPYVHVHDYVLDEAASTPATCTEPGEDVYVCRGAGECDEPSYSVGIPASGHAYVNHEAQEPTCTEPGWEAYQTCSRCDFSTYEEIPKNGHQPGEWVLTTEPQVGVAGKETLFCLICGDPIDTRETDPLDEPDEPNGHDYVYTSNEDGTHTITCRNCSYEDSGNCDYNETPHEATCETGAFITYTCKYCGYSFNGEQGQPNGHDFIYTPNNDGTHTITCRNCDYESSGDCDYDTVDHDATCETGAYTKYTCKLCEYTYDGPQGEPNGHAYVYTSDNNGKHVVTCENCTLNQTDDCDYDETPIAATCTAGGYTVYTCKFCDYTFNGEAGQPNGHKYGTEGADVYTCTVCGVVDEFRKALAELTEMTTEAENLLEEIKNNQNISEETRQNLETAIENAQTVLNDPNATPKEIETAKQQLNDTIDAVKNELKADETVTLTETTQEAKDILKQIEKDRYVDEEVITQLKEAIENAEKVMNDPNSTEEQIKEAQEALNNAIIAAQDAKVLADKRRICPLCGAHHTGLRALFIIPIHLIIYIFGRMFHIL